MGGCERLHWWFLELRRGITPFRKHRLLVCTPHSGKITVFPDRGALAGSLGPGQTIMAGAGGAQGSGRWERLSEAALVYTVICRIAYETH
jgi:hypothetical protein